MHACMYVYVESTWGAASVLHTGLNTLPQTEKSINLHTLSKSIGGEG